MKNIINRITAAAALAFVASGAIQEAKATDVQLKGTGYYSLGRFVTYRNRAPVQTGRYSSLGSDYYHSGEIGMDVIKNNSTTASGDLSFEFWAMRYYKASTGIVLMTRAVKALPGGTHYNNVVRTGQAVSIDRRRFPELDLWEFTTNGWKFRDALSFNYRDIL